MDGRTGLIVLAGFLSALLATLCLTPLARWVACIIGVVDNPDGNRKLQKKPVPLLGGIAVFAGIAMGLTTLAAGSLVGHDHLYLLATLTGMALLCAVGVCDDVWALSARRKFAAQIVAIFPIVCWGPHIESISLCGYSLELGAGGLLLAGFWMLLGINAINLIDGMDGLASITGLCIALGAAAIGYSAGATQPVILAAALAGPLIGFLVYNFPPASIYMGDAGSMVVGLAVSLLSMQLAEVGTGHFNFTRMSILMAVPVGDTLLAIVRRWLSGRRIWNPDRGHMHHQLLNRGLTARQALACVAGMCLLSSICAGLARVPGWEAAAWGALCAIGVVLVRARLMGHHEWSLMREQLRDRVSVMRLAVPSAEQLESLSFEDGWSLLVKACQVASASNVELLTGCATGHTTAHRWQASDAVGGGEAMTLNFRARHISTWCRLTISTRQEINVGRWQTRHLLNLASVLGRYWAETDSASTPDTLPMPAVSERPAARHARGRASRSAA